MKKILIAIIIAATFTIAGTINALCWADNDGKKLVEELQETHLKYKKLACCRCYYEDYSCSCNVIPQKEWCDIEFQDEDVQDKPSEQYLRELEAETYDCLHNKYCTIGDDGISFYHSTPSQDEIQKSKQIIKDCNQKEGCRAHGDHSGFYLIEIIDFTNAHLLTIKDFEYAEVQSTAVIWRIDTDEGFAFQGAYQYRIDKGFKSTSMPETRARLTFELVMRHPSNNYSDRDAIVYWYITRIYKENPLTTEETE